jgi:hypothetical protein
MTERSSSQLCNAPSLPNPTFDVVELVKESLASGATDAYEQAVAALENVSAIVVADWWQS